MSFTANQTIAATFIKDTKKDRYKMKKTVIKWKRPL